ncbi:MAG: hypothetical protein IT176_09225 [Acidobacteria bacterium]|nr:hypothetical protein [Acidobacteriota bacterium]
MTLMSRIGVLFMTSVMLATPVRAQQSTTVDFLEYDASRAAGGPFSRDPVLNAPFSADVTTTVRTTFPRGTARLETVKARYYRDLQGRVRAEVDTPWGPYVVVAIPEPDYPRVVVYYKLDLQKRTYAGPFGQLFASEIFNGEGRVALPVGRACFQTAPAVLLDASDEERLSAVNAQVSPAIGIVTESHRSDPIAVVDYKVTNIRRSEPPAMLFDLTDYTYEASPDDPPFIFAPWQKPPSAWCTSRSR